MQDVAGFQPQAALLKVTAQSLDDVGWHILLNGIDGFPERLPQLCHAVFVPPFDRILHVRPKALHF